MISPLFSTLNTLGSSGVRDACGGRGLESLDLRPAALGEAFPGGPINAPGQHVREEGWCAWK